MTEDRIKKGTLLVVKAPPYYLKEYLYEVTSAGVKVVRANLRGSTKVKKHWGKEELEFLIDLKIIRVVDDSEPYASGFAPS